MLDKDMYEAHVRACDRRIGDMERDICNVTKPETGALALIKNECLRKINELGDTLHEKINRIADTRVKWLIFWSINVALAACIGFTFSYAKSISDDQKELKSSIEKKMETQTASIIEEIRKAKQ